MTQVNGLVWILKNSLTLLILLFFQKWHLQVITSSIMNMFYPWPASLIREKILNLQEKYVKNSMYMCCSGMYKRYFYKNKGKCKNMSFLMQLQ